MDDANKISQSNESLQVTQRSRVGFISSKNRRGGCGGCGGKIKVTSPFFISCSTIALDSKF